MIRVPALLVLPILLLFVSPASADFSGFASSGFTYCYVQFETYGDDSSCTRSDLSVGGYCTVGCVAASTAYGEIEGYRPWRIMAEGNSGSGDAIFQSTVFVEAQRIAADTLRIQGDCDDQAGTPEIALFYFAGDPSIFDGTSAVTVDELIELGLIDSRDLFWEYQCSNSGDFSFDVGVYGFPDEQIVLFAGSMTYPGQGGGGGGDGGSPVPTMSLWGAMALTLLLFGVGAFALRRAS